MDGGGAQGAIVLGAGGARLGSVATRGGWLRFRVVVVLVGVVAGLGCVAALVTLPSGTAGRATTGHHGLESLPLTAQGPVSAVLGRDEKAYRVTALQALNPSQHLHAGFTRSGVTVASGTARLGMALSAYGYASALESVGSAPPRASVNRVIYAHGALTEWYANGPLGIEQGFDVAARPNPATGPLTLSLALSGNLSARLLGGSVLLAGRGAALHYGGLLATDVRGRVLRSWLQLVKGHVLIHVDDHGATYPLRIDPLIQQGEKLVGDCTSSCVNEGTGEIGEGGFGGSVAVSADGNTALVSAPAENGKDGAVWVFTRTEGVWTEQTKLVGDCTSSCANEGTGESAAFESGGAFGSSVALSADGNTALIGGMFDNFAEGAAWVFTRSGGAWTQQGAKLIGDCTSSCAHEGTGETTGPGMAGDFGISVALSGDGNTALIGAENDSNNGAAWVFTRSSGEWAQQGSKLTGGEEVGESRFGFSVALSGDGNTALIGGNRDGGDATELGAAWVFTRSEGAWTQQGAKLVGDCTSSCAHEGTGEIEILHPHDFADFGFSVALSGDGDTALIGAPGDNGDTGAVWVFARSGGAWAQLGPKLVGDCTSNCANQGTGEIEDGSFGQSVAVSADGDTALIGADFDGGFVPHTGEAGAAWLFTRAGGALIQQGAKLVGDCTSNCANEGTGEAEYGHFGSSVALSADARTALIGGPEGDGAAWAFGVIGAPAISSVPSLSFGSQTTSQPGPVQWLQVDSSGQAQLTFTGPAQIGGADAGDFTIPAGDDLCEGKALDSGQACWIGVQFTAGVEGPRSATLSFGANNTTTPPTTVSLTGTGVAANSGPAGSSGTNGTNGTQGPGGPQGSIGPAGPTGSQGPAGRVELVTCKTVKRKQRCTTKLVSGPVTFTTAGAAARAMLSRRGRVVATGTVRTVHGHAEFVSNYARVLPRGRYTLTITRKAGRHITETHEAITIT